MKEREREREGKWTETHRERERERESDISRVGKKLKIYKPTPFGGDCCVLLRTAPIETISSSRQRARNLADFEDDRRLWSHTLESRSKAVHLGE